VPMPLETGALVALVGRIVPRNAPPPSRRWPRKPVTRAVPAQIGERPAVLLNVSYGGMCLEIDAPPEALPAAVDVVFPDSRQTVRAALVWRNQRDDRTWLCGAEIPTVTEDWRLLVDAIS
jgi:PilZ domain